jgi:NCAIR mutase (PurE)-related protein
MTDVSSPPEYAKTQLDIALVAPKAARLFCERQMTAFNRPQFESLARRFRAGRLSLAEFADSVLAGLGSAGSPDNGQRLGPTDQVESVTDPGRVSTIPTGGPRQREPSESSVTLDLDRARRCGWPEVIFAPGKTQDELRMAADQLLAARQNVLVTRVDPAIGEWLSKVFPDAVHNSVARTVRINRFDDRAVEATVAAESVGVVTAGTADRPVAEEVCETLSWMAVPMTRAWDVGVAGPHRLAPHLDRLARAKAIVVVAGMDGALPSVVAGYVGCPVIAVPTSVGFGTSFEGIAPLLTMLNSCAANVAVVNIDGGFKAGFLAGLIATQARSARSRAPSRSHQAAN